MAKRHYIGINNVSRKIKQPYGGVDNVVRKVTSGYIGEDNVARQFFDGVEHPSVHYHTWELDGRIWTDPTCTSSGEYSYTCTGCGETKTEIIPATGHNIGSNCKCSYCGETIHDLENTGNGTDPTCTSAGKAYYVCNRCGEVVEETLPAIEHDYHNDNQQGATCTEDGYIDWVCWNCNHSYREITESALGHSYQGGECTRCGDISPEWGTCPTCGRKYLLSDGCAYCM